MNDQENIPPVPVISDSNILRIAKSPTKSPSSSTKKRSITSPIDLNNSAQWEDRNAVITSVQHQENSTAAQQIVENLVENLPCYRDTEIKFAVEEVISDTESRVSTLKRNPVVPEETLSTGVPQTNTNNSLVSSPIPSSDKPVQHKSYSPESLVNTAQKKLTELSPRQLVLDTQDTLRNIDESFENSFVANTLVDATKEELVVLSPHDISVELKSSIKQGCDFSESSIGKGSPGNTGESKPKSRLDSLREEIKELLGDDSFKPPISPLSPLVATESSANEGQPIKEVDKVEDSSNTVSESACSGLVVSEPNLEVVTKEVCSEDTSDAQEENETPYGTANSSLEDHREVCVVEEIVEALVKNSDISQTSTCADASITSEETNDKVSLPSPPSFATASKTEAGILTKLDPDIDELEALLTKFKPFAPSPRVDSSLASDLYKCNNQIEPISFELEPSNLVEEVGTVPESVETNSVSSPSPTDTEATPVLNSLESKPEIVKEAESIVSVQESPIAGIVEDIPAETLHTALIREGLEVSEGLSQEQTIPTLTETQIEPCTFIPEVIVTNDKDLINQSLTDAKAENILLNPEDVKCSTPTEEKNHSITVSSELFNVKSCNAENLQIIERETNTSVASSNTSSSEDPKIIPFEAASQSIDIETAATINIATSESYFSYLKNSEVSDVATIPDYNSVKPFVTEPTENSEVDALAFDQSKTVQPVALESTLLTEFALSTSQSESPISIRQSEVNACQRSPVEILETQSQLCEIPLPLNVYRDSVKSTTSSEFSLGVSRNEFTPSDSDPNWNISNPFSDFSGTDFQPESLFSMPTPVGDADGEYRGNDQNLVPTDFVNDNVQNSSFLISGDKPRVELDENINPFETKCNIAPQTESNENLVTVSAQVNSAFDSMDTSDSLPAESNDTPSPVDTIIRSDGTDELKAQNQEEDEGITFDSEKENLVSAATAFEDYAENLDSGICDHIVQPVDSKYDEQDGDAVGVASVNRRSAKKTTPSVSVDSEPASPSHTNLLNETLSGTCSPDLSLGASAPLINHSEAGPEVAQFTEDEFRSAAEVFKDPADFDFLLRAGSSKVLKESTLSRLSLYVKFDPLVKVTNSTPPVQPTKDIEQTSDSGKIPESKPQRQETEQLDTCGEKGAKQNLNTSKLIEFDSPKNVKTAKQTPKMVPVEPMQRFEANQQPEPGKFFTEEDMKKALQIHDLLYQERILKKEKEGVDKEKSFQGEIAELQRHLKLQAECLSCTRKLLNETTRMSKLWREKKEQERVEQTKERDQALEDLQSVETAFGDLHKRYEKTKTVLEGYKQKENELRQELVECQEKLRKQEQMFEALRSRTEEQLDGANVEIENAKKSGSSELAVLSAQLKKSEMKVVSLERTLVQKEQEFEELSRVYDDLIARFESQRN